MGRTGLFNKRKEELNFIERKRQWKTQLDKPYSRRSLIMVLPALILCVFVMLAAPYLKIIVEKYMSKETELNVTLPLNLDDEPEKAEKAGPPPSPEQVMVELRRAELEKEGFDWRKKPEVEGPDLSFAKNREVEVKPVDVELPVTMSELQRQAGTDATVDPAE